MEKTFACELQRLFPGPEGGSHSVHCASTMAVAAVLGNMGVHEKSIMKSRKRTFECSWCHQLFKKKDHMKSHTRRHTGETPYVCPGDNCNLRFMWRSSLKNHLRYHDRALSSPVTPAGRVMRDAGATSPPSLVIEPSVAMMADDVVPATEQDSTNVVDSGLEGGQHGGRLHIESEKRHLDFFGSFLPQETLDDVSQLHTSVDGNAARKRDMHAALVEIEYILNPNES